MALYSAHHDRINNSRPAPDAAVSEYGRRTGAPHVTLPASAGGRSGASGRAVTGPQGPLDQRGATLTPPPQERGSDSISLVSQASNFFDHPSGRRARGLHSIGLQVRNRTT